MRRALGRVLALSLLAAPLGAQTGLRAGAEGIVLRAGGDALLLRVTGRLQYDSRVFLEEAAPGTTDALYLRRAAPGVQATLFRNYDLRLNADVSDGRPEPLEVSATARFSPAVQLRAGKVRVPLGLARQQGSASAAFIENGLGSALAPARDVGVELRGVVAGLLEYSVGAYNGVPDGGNGELEWSGGKDLVARGFLRPYARRADHPLRGLGLGVGGSVGRHQGSPEEPFLPAYRTGGRETFFRSMGGGAPTYADGVRRRLAPQAYLYAGRAGVLAEYVVSSGRVRRGDETARLDDHAWQAVGSWVLTGEPAAFAGVVPATRFDPRAGTWGALELALRADGLQADRDAFPRFADATRYARSARSVGAALNWYPNRNVRFQLDYQRTGFTAPPSAAPRMAEHLLLTRLQLGI